MVKEGSSRTVVLTNWTTEHHV